jgi:hypothetical protein
MHEPARFFGTLYHVVRWISCSYLADAGIAHCRVHGSLSNRDAAGTAVAVGGRVFAHGPPTRMFGDGLQQFSALAATLRP